MATVRETWPATETEVASKPSDATSQSRARRREQRELEPEPLLETHPARWVEPVARCVPFTDRHPALAGALTALAGYLALLCATVLIGWVLVELVLPGWVNHTDNQANVWLAGHRTPTWDTVSVIGSDLGETVTVIAICGLVVAVLLWHRRWYAATFVAVAISLEAVVYLGTVLVITRPRPPVVRLEDLAAGASYPSGHTAAAVVTYGALALIVTASAHRRWVRAGVVVLAVLAPAAVALARVYRGMHHPTDVVSGAVIGCGCLLVGLLVAEVARGAAIRRAAMHATSLERAGETQDETTDDRTGERTAAP